MNVEITTKMNQYTILTTNLAIKSLEVVIEATIVDKEVSDAPKPEKKTLIITTSEKTTPTDQ